MFSTFTHGAVDAIQAAKTQFVTTYIQHKGISNALTSFIDAQGAYTKSAIDAGMKASSALGAIISSQACFDEIMKPSKAK